MVGYNSTPVVAKLQCNRLYRMCHTVVHIRMKWNLDPADPTEHICPGDGSDM